jgi:hypothetical protein
MIDNAPANTVAVGGEDVMLGGNMDGWKRFANTLKLRILLRQSTKAETDATLATYLNTEFANLDLNFVNEDITINPGYSNASDVQQNPWMNLMQNLDEDDVTYRTAYNFRRASSYIAGRLNNTPPDPRRGRIFTLISGNVVGVNQGDSSAPSGTAPADMSKLGPGLVINSAQDGYVMLLAESLLLQAEAVERGFIPGDAQTLFDAAITASMNKFGVFDDPTATPVPLFPVSDYISAVNLVDGKGYAASVNKIQALMYQKSIALNGINGLEVWIEYTRTGLINNIPMPLNSSSPTNQKPLRLMYPTSELASNSANVPAQSVNDVFTTGVFWK